MRRILYISTVKSTLVQGELEQILRISRTNNSAVDVTGLLVSGGRRFLQALEGPDGAVQTTFERIARDPRHHAIVMLNDSVIETRAFKNWSMGYQAGAEAGQDIPLSAQVAAIVSPIPDATLRAYFTGFADRHSA